MTLTPDQIKALYVIASVQGAVVLFMAVQAWLDARCDAHEKTTQKQGTE